MNPRLREYLRQMHVAAQDCIDFVAGMSLEEFSVDIKTQRAVTMSLILLGEGAARIGEHHPDFLRAHPEIAWTAMRGMRNRIAHEYFLLNVETIWATLDVELPLLLRQIEASAPTK